MSKPDSIRHRRSASQRKRRRFLQRRVNHYTNVKHWAKHFSRKSGTTYILKDKSTLVATFETHLAVVKKTPGGKDVYIAEWDGRGAE